MKNLIRVAVAAVGALVLAVSLSSCAQSDNTLAVPQAFCGFIQGNGGRDSNNNANTADVTDVLNQGQTANYRDDQKTGYVFPCVSRNYVIAPPEAPSKDSDQPVRGVTADGVPVVGWVSGYWQPNQAPEPLREFIKFVQFKYGAAATDPTSFTGTEKNANASTPGWNKFLAENMWPTLNRLFERAVAEVPNSVWQKRDPALRDQIATQMSEEFADEFRKTTGSTLDLICGNGSTGTGNTFNCKELYIVVDGIFAEDPNQQNAANAASAREAQRALDQQQLDADKALTNAKYGPLAEAFRACRDLNTAAPGTCKFITGPGGAQIQVP